MNKAKDYLLEGGLDYAKELLSKALGPQRAGEILNKVAEASQLNRPFAIARKADAQQILNIINYEHPQTIALILCYLQVEKAAQIIAELPEEIQSEVALRIATMNTTSPDVIREIEKVLDDKLSTIVKTETTVLGGIDTLVGILNQVDRTTEKNITESLQEQDYELAEKIKSCMFVFEDIIILDDRAIQRVLREVDSRELALSMKGTKEEIKEKIFKNMSERAQAMLQEDIEYLGPVRAREVQDAQTKIVATIRALELSGEITISRGSAEDELIE